MDTKTGKSCCICFQSNQAWGVYADTMYTRNVQLILSWSGVSMSSDDTQESMNMRKASFEHMQTMLIMTRAAHPHSEHKVH